MRTVYYPGPSVPPELHDVEQVHHVAGVHLRRGPVEIVDDAIAEQLVAAGLVTAEPPAPKARPEIVSAADTPASFVEDVKLSRRQRSAAAEEKE